MDSPKRLTADWKDRALEWARNRSITTDDPMTGNDREHLEDRLAEQEDYEWYLMAREALDEWLEENPY